MMGERMLGDRRRWVAWRSGDVRTWSEEVGGEISKLRKAGHTMNERRSSAGMRGFGSVESVCSTTTGVGSSSSETPSQLDSSDTSVAR